MTLLLTIIAIILGLVILNAIMPFLVGVVIFLAVISIPVLAVGMIASNDMLGAIIILLSFLAVAAILDWKRTKELFNA